MFVFFYNSTIYYLHGPNKQYHVIFTTLLSLKINCFYFHFSNLLWQRHILCYQSQLLSRRHLLQAKSTRRQVHVPLSCADWGLRACRCKIFRCSNQARLYCSEVWQYCGQYGSTQHVCDLPRHSRLSWILDYIQKMNMCDVRDKCFTTSICLLSAAFWFILFFQPSQLIIFVYVSTYITFKLMQQYICSLKHLVMIAIISSSICSPHIIPWD